MSDTPFLGELRLMSFDFPPKGWVECNGQTMTINQNQALFSLLGTMYGGDGKVNFQLPDLRGRAQIHRAGGYSQGTRVGEETHLLTQSEMPAHNHFLQASSANADQPVPSILAAGNNLYAAFGNLTTLHPSSITNQGGSQAHENRHPFLTLNWCMALIGIFPSLN